jgi:hypothetical protein
MIRNKQNHWSPPHGNTEDAGKGVTILLIPTTEKNRENNKNKGLVIRVIAKNYD